MKRLLPLLIALFPAVVNAQAFRVGSGIQIVPRATAPAKVAANGSVWLKLSDSTLHFVNPAGTDIALGAGGGGSVSLTCTGPLTCTPSTITGTGSVALGTTGPGAVTTGGGSLYIASVTTDAYGRVASMTTGTPPGATAITTGRVAYGTGTSITGSPDFTFDGVKVSTLNLWSSFLTMTPQTLASCTYGSSTAGCLAYDTATSLLKYSNNNGISWTALGGGSTVRNLWWSPVDIAGNVAPSFSSAGSFAVGQGFMPQVAMTQTGVRFYYPDTTSRTIKVSLWDNTGTRVATSTATYNTAGVKTVTWGTPVAVMSSQAYKYWNVSMWDTSGTGFIQTTGVAASEEPTFPAQNGPSISWRAISSYGTGDVSPSATFNSTGGAIYPIEPVFTVP
jgi:hypothetical protein